jgi:hypothetical protein
MAFTLSVRSFQVPASHFRHEGPELPHHGVHHLADAQEFAAQRAALDLQIHGLGKVAARHGADHAGHFGGWLDQVGDQAVNRFDVRRPRSGRIGQLRAVADLAFLADHIP